MKLNQFPVILFLVLTATMLTGCDAIEGIFKVGMWTGIIIVVAIVALVIWLINRMRK